MEKQLKKSIPSANWSDGMWTMITKAECPGSKLYQFIFWGIRWVLVKKHCRNIHFIYNRMIFALIYFSEMNVDCTIWWLKNNGTAKASLSVLSKPPRCMTTLILYVYCYHGFPYVCFLRGFLALWPLLMGRQWTVDGWTEGLDASLKFCIRFLRTWLSDLQFSFCQFPQKI